MHRTTCHDWNPPGTQVLSHAKLSHLSSLLTKDCCIGITSFDRDTIKPCWLYPIFPVTANNTTYAMDKRSFKVIVVGGSIAGLTLAHSLDLAGIDYIVLEKHLDPLATVGGSVGLLPNRWRILHQLGLRHQLEQEACPVKVAHMTYPDGFVFSDNFPGAIQERQAPPYQLCAS